MDLADKDERKRTLGAGAGSSERFVARALTTSPDLTNVKLPIKLSDLTQSAQALHSPDGLGIMILLPTTMLVGNKNTTPIMLYECEIGPHPQRVEFRVIGAEAGQ